MKYKKLASHIRQVHSQKKATNFLYIVQRFKMRAQNPKRNNLLKKVGPLTILIGFIGTVIGLWADITGNAILPTINQETQMTGDFRVGVASFIVETPSIDTRVGYELAQGVYARMVETATEHQTDFTINVWGPDRLPPITGQTALLREEVAAEIAANIDADLLVYGSITLIEGKWQITPEFYVNDQSFVEAAELTGHHQLGAAFSIPNEADLISRITVSREYKSRIQALVFLTIGLAYYADNMFSEAVTYFQLAETVENWPDNTGKEVLYLLIGNGEMKQDHLSEAESHYRHALELDSNYARAYIGLASVYYLRALEPARITHQPDDINLRFLDRAIRTYQKALTVPNQPTSLNVTTKIHLGLGQSYLSRQYIFYKPGSCAKLDDFTLAITELAQVTTAYGDPEQPTNTHIQEFAAEAYGRLGLIYMLTCNKPLAIQNYEMAAALSITSERRSYFQSSLASLQE